MDAPQRRRRFGPVVEVVAIIALLTWAALCVCDYRFGTNDQAQYLVDVIAHESPGAFADDPYLQAFGALRSAFWPAVAAVSTEATRPVACLAITIGIIAANVLLLLRLGALVGGTRRAALAAVPALLLVVPKEQNWFGLVALGDVELTATLAALPLLLASILAWVGGRTAWSGLAAAAIVPIHGQTGAYALVAWWGASLWTHRRTVRATLALAAVGGAGLGALAAEHATRRLADADLDRFEHVGRALFPELVDPRAASASAWGALAAVLALGAVAAVALRRERTPGEPRTVADDACGRLVVWGAAGFAFPLAGVLLIGAGARDPLLWMLMPGRAFALPQIAAMILLGAWAIRRAAADSSGATVAGAVVCLITLWPSGFGSVPLAAGAIIASILIVARPRRWGTGPPVAIDHAPRPGANAWPAALPAFGAVLTLGAARFVDHRFPWLEPGLPAEWRAVQQWARTHTDADALFITPPYLSGWRLESHRAAFGEWKDGGLLFYAGRPAFDWAERMTLLGAVDVPRWIEIDQLLDADRLDSARLERWRRAYHDAAPRVAATLGREVYVIAEIGAVDAETTVLWRNATFGVCRVAPDRPSAPQRDR